MGATKELSLAESEYTINMTFKIQGKHRVPFEQGMRSVEEISVIDYRVMHDTQWLYDNDITFRKMVKEEKKRKDAKLDYINKHNKK